MINKKEEKSFWVTNISKMNVCLRDLAFTIKAGSHANLLDSRHYNFTLEQLQKSADSGSLFRKRDKIKIRKVLPDHLKRQIVVSTEPMYKKTLLSQVQIKEEKFDELIETEEAQAEDIADIIAGIDQEED